MTSASTSRFDCGDDITFLAPEGSRFEAAQGRSVITAPGGTWRCVITRHNVKGAPVLAAEADKVFRTFSLRQSAAEVERDTYDLSGPGFSALARDYRIASDMGAGHIATLAVFVHAGAAFSVAITAREVSGELSPLPTILAEQLHVSGTPDEPIASDSNEIKLTLDLPPLSAPTAELATLDFPQPTAGIGSPATPTAAPSMTLEFAPRSDALPPANEFQPAPPPSDLPPLSFADAPATPAPTPPAPPAASKPGATRGLSLEPRSPVAPAAEGLDFTPPPPSKAAQRGATTLTAVEVPAHGIILTAPLGWAKRDDGNGAEHEASAAFFLVIEATVASSSNPETGIERSVATAQEKLSRVQQIGEVFRVQSVNCDIDVAEFDWWDEGKPEPYRLFVLSWYNIPTEVPYLNDQGELLHLRTCAWLVVPKSEYERNSAAYRKMLEGIDTKPEKSLVFSASYATSRAGINTAASVASAQFPVAPDAPSPRPRPKLRVLNIDDGGMDVAFPAHWKQARSQNGLVGDKASGAQLKVVGIEAAFETADPASWGGTQLKQVAEEYNARPVGNGLLVRRPAHEAVLLEFDYIDGDIAKPCKLFVYNVVNANVPDKQGEKLQINLAAYWRVPADEFARNEGLYRWLVQTQASIRRPGKSDAVAQPEPDELEAAVAESFAPHDPITAIERGIRVARRWILGALFTYVLALIFYAGLGEIYYEAALALAAAGLGIWGTILYSRAKAWPQWALILAIVGELIPVVGLILLFVLYDRASKDLADS